MFRKEKSNDSDDDSTKLEENSNEGTTSPPSPFLLTVLPNFYPIDQSKSTDESERNDQSGNKNQSGKDDKFDLDEKAKEIDSIIKTKFDRKEYVNSCINEKKEAIHFLILQLATLKTYSKIQVIDENFNNVEKQNYEAFLSILNKYNLDSDDSPTLIIDDIKKEYDKDPQI